MRDFYRTQAGKKFFEHDVPAFITALNNVVSELQKLNTREERKTKLDEKFKRSQIKESKKE